MMLRVDIFLWITPLPFPRSLEWSSPDLHKLSAGSCVDLRGGLGEGVQRTHEQRACVEWTVN